MDLVQPHRQLHTLGADPSRGIEMSARSKFVATLVALHVGMMGMAVAPIAQAQDSQLDGCLKAWDKHPFGKDPKYKTLQVAVKVFGIGQNTVDTEVTSAPALIVVQPGVNVMGGSVIELLNPNGWYCLKTSVNVMGGLTIRAHCKAKIAAAHENVSVASNNEEGKAITVLGSTRVERVGCPEGGDGAKPK
jgi:hypothetical protein